MGRFMVVQSGDQSIVLPSSHDAFVESFLQKLFTVRFEDGQMNDCIDKDDREQEVEGGGDRDLIGILALINGELNDDQGAENQRNPEGRRVHRTDPRDVANDSVGLEWDDHGDAHQDEDDADDEYAHEPDQFERRADVHAEIQLGLAVLRESVHVLPLAVEQYLVVGDDAEDRELQGSSLSARL